MERVEGLVAVVKSLGRAHTLWSEDDEARLEPLLEAVADTCDYFGGGDLPASLRDLARRVERLDTEHRQFMAHYEEGTQEPPPRPWWQALEAVVAAGQTADPPPPVALETVAELTTQRVGDKQICEIYGWVDDRGRPQYDKLREERAAPGTHTGRGFVPPVERERAQRAQRDAAILARTKARTEQRIEALAKRAPETWQELFSQGVSAKQICKIKRCTLDDVAAKARELGVEMPELDYADVRTARAPQEPQPSAERTASVGKGVAKPRENRPAAAPAEKATSKARGRPKGTGPRQREALDAEIERLAGEGLDAGEILARLESEPGATPERVEAILAQAQTA